MKKGTPEQIAQKREEIINACEKLYRTTGFREITLKEIGGITSFSRPTIYNYFETKEEIFLALYKREYDLWNEALSGILNEDGPLAAEQLADRIAGSLADRPQLLKLLSMNNYDMEANSRKEMLVEFKQSYGKSMDLMRSILKKHCPKMSARDAAGFIYTFYPFMFGIFPYASVTEKQREAMQEAGVEFVYQSIHELVKGCIIRLLGQNGCN